MGVMNDKVKPEDVMAVQGDPLKVFRSGAQIEDVMAVQGGIEEEKDYLLLAENHFVQLPHPDINFSTKVFVNPNYVAPTYARNENDVYAVLKDGSIIRFQENDDDEPVYKLP